LAPGAVGGVPRRVEWVGDILVLPPDALTHPVWTAGAADGNGGTSGGGATTNDGSAVGAVTTVSAPVWDLVAATFGAARVARAAAIHDGPTRASRMTMLKTTRVPGAWELPPRPAGLVLLPARHSTLPVASAPTTAAAYAVPPTLRLDAGGWTAVREGGVTYALDVTRLMFSSGNVTEKARMGRGLRGAAAGEVVVDLFAGLGYYTLQLLAHAGVAHVHAADWNPDALAALRINLALNRVPPERCTVWPGDNAALASAPAVARTAHRVLLGLLPSSERAWPTAVALLRPEGGVCHVHANVGEEELDAWRAHVERSFRALAAAAGGRAAEWSRFAVTHVERVKSYAPRVWHVVADLEIRR
jgi:hypothetical protein